MHAPASVAQTISLTRRGFPNERLRLQPCRDILRCHIRATDIIRLVGMQAGTAADTDDAARQLP